MELQTMANGLVIGSLVQIYGMPEGDGCLNGRLGQLLSYQRATDQFEIALVSGETPNVDSKNVRVPVDLKKPGTGGDPASFDMVMGPRTPGNFLAEELADCIFEKGFCVLKTCQSVAALEGTVEALRELGDEGQLGRLPVEVEEGYLGAGGKGKIAWIDAQDGIDCKNELLQSCDDNISTLAGLFQPYSADVLGAMVAERTPGMVSLSLQSDEEADYPQPMASDKVLGDYLGTWRRGLLRVIHFLGPPVANVTLEAREGSAAAGLPVQLDKVSVEASPGTILLFRPDCYSFSCEADEEVAFLMASLQSEAPNLVVTGYEGELRALGAEGPPAPPGDCINILEHDTRLGLGWDSGEMMNTAMQGGCDAISEIPVVRFNVDYYYCPDPDELLMGPARMIQRHTSFVEGLDLFDNKYFEISNNEAGGMGPLQRQVLEVGKKLCEKNGLPKKLANRKSHHSGFAVGLDKDDFPGLGIDSGTAMNALAIIANRFSFVFNLKGPNFITDTACSASLTAVHVGKMMLYERNYDPLEWLIAIGTHLCLSPGPWIGTSMNHMVSPEGRCFTFNASANGYLRGEGTSGIFCKYGSSASDVQRDCILRATNVAQDGRSASLTAPNGPAQEEMIARAVKEARMTAPESTCWECHGTGTSLGDPIEVGAVRKIQIKTPRKDDPLIMSTMKSNIGHLEGGAAMAGMIKCVQQVMHSQCLTSLHCRQLNPHLDHAAFEAFFETELSTFKYDQGHCQVTSLGFGGSNGHGIFWGRKHDKFMPSPERQIMKHISKMASAEVRVLGDNPDDWEADLPSADHKPGDKYSIFFSSDDPKDPKDTPVRWVKQEADEEEEEDAAFSIVGNFNNWEEDRMAPGDVPGQHTTNVTVPSDGILEFRILKDGDPDQVIGPNVPKCGRKTAPIKGPEKGLTNTWYAKIEADVEVQIELLCLKGTYSILWFKN